MRCGVCQVGRQGGTKHFCPKLFPLGGKLGPDPTPTQTTHSENPPDSPSKQTSFACPVSTQVLVTQADNMVAARMRYVDISDSGGDAMLNMLVLIGCYEV